MDGSALTAFAIEEDGAGWHLRDFIQIVFTRLIEEPTRDQEGRNQKGE
jgi:hypothetical protein